ncbi:MAG: DUF4174 domain-containing protein [Rhodobacteraceae bacterium]|nr:DUF4174 domain-containing protein [Paracoccaceae bacterium]
MRLRWPAALVLALLLPAAAPRAAGEAGDVAAMAAVGPAAATVAAAGQGDFAPLEAAGVTLAGFLWQARPVVVFADSPADPLFVRQLSLLAEGWADLAARDVVVIVDTDPAAASDARRRLRPRGFSLVFVDKDGAVKQRKPQPWTARELVHAIDRTPLRRQEMEEERPAGR